MLRAVGRSFGDGLRAVLQAFLVHVDEPVLREGFQDVPRYAHGVYQLVVEAAGRVLRHETGVEAYVVPDHGEVSDELEEPSERLFGKRRILQPPLVMPVSISMYCGMESSLGLTRLAKEPVASPPLIFTADTSMTSQCSKSSPVVSTSDGDVLRCRNVQRGFRRAQFHLSLEGTVERENVSTRLFPEQLPYHGADFKCRGFLPGLSAASSGFSAFSSPRAFP